MFPLFSEQKYSGPLDYGMSCLINEYNGETGDSQADAVLVLVEDLWGKKKKKTPLVWEGKLRQFQNSLTFKVSFSLEIRLKTISNR